MKKQTVEEMLMHGKEFILMAAHKALPEEELKFRVAWIAQAVLDMIIDKAKNFSLSRDARGDESSPTREVERLKNDY